MYSVFCLHISLQARRGHQISLQMVVSTCGCWELNSGHIWKSRQSSKFFFVRTTQQNKISVYCWTLFHTYIKQAKKKINSNFIDKKKEEKKETFIFGLFNPSHPNQLLIVQLGTYTKKVTGMLGIRLVFFVVIFVFFYKVFFSPLRL